MDVRFACRTDPGTKRPRNEDAVLVDPALGFAVVADGMGGHRAGDLASQLVIDTVVAELGDGIGDTEAVIRETLVRALQLANYSIRMVSNANPETHGGMGSTATVLVLRQGRYYVANVGDSRAYRLRRGEIEQVTEDHSLVQQQVVAGNMTAEEASRHQLRNVVTRAVGRMEALEVDVFSGPLADGDVFLLCSDGLSNGVPPATIRRTLEEYSQLDLGAAELIRLGCEADGSDNISVALARLDKVGVPVAAVGPAAAGDEEEPELVGVEAQETDDEDDLPFPTFRHRAPRRRWPVLLGLFLLILGGALVGGVKLGMLPDPFASPSPEPTAVAVLPGTPVEVISVAPTAVSGASGDEVPGAEPTTPPIAAVAPPVAEQPTATAVPVVAVEPTAVPTSVPAPAAAPTSPPRQGPRPTDAAGFYGSGHAAAKGGDMASACEDFADMLRTTTATHTLQVAVNRLPASTIDMLRKAPDDTNVYFIWRRDLHWVYAGLFGSKEEAIAANSALPKPYQQPRPVVSTTASVLSDAACGELRQ